MAKPVKNLLTIHSSETVRLITDKQFQELDLFRRPQTTFAFEYTIFRQEDEQAVFTFDLKLA